MHRRGPPGVAQLCKYCKGILPQFLNNYLVNEERELTISFENSQISLLPQITLEYLSRATKRIK
jgi:hypothetical protein